ncbi:MAG: hypothetical protein KDB07_07355, partial [Planctomycetes bacterium]|nr:hypothetical protein [Planctomycetota bacterium]
MVSIPRPGVEVLQEIRNPTPNFFEPTLPALVMAPAFEVIELYVDSALNPDAKYTDEDGDSYDNFRSMTFYQTEFPGGHVTDSTGGLTNTKAGQVNVLEEEIRAFLDYGTIRELAEHDTSDNTRVLKGFLVSHNVANRPFVRGSVDISAGGLALSGSFLQVAIDIIGGSYPHYLPNSSEGLDTVITFSTGSETGGTLSSQDVVDQINAIIPNLAYLYTTTAGAEYLALVSPEYGANARVIIRDTGASSTLGFHSIGGGDLYALGGGFRARDDG